MIIEKNIQGHKRFIRDLHPDFIKLMSDGYFAYPNPVIGKGKSLQELAEIEPLGEDHPWIREQVELVKKIKQEFTEDIVAIYNIFAPVTYLKWLLGEVSGGDDLIADFLVQDPQKLKKVLDVIAQDIASLSQSIIRDAGADGILSLIHISEPTRPY